MTESRLGRKIAQTFQTRSPPSEFVDDFNVIKSVCSPPRQQQSLQQTSAPVKSLPHPSSLSSYTSQLNSSIPVVPSGSIVRMDQRHNTPAFHPGRFFRIGQDNWYLDIEGNWFLWDASSENWVLSGEAESAIPNGTALALHSVNANAFTATGYDRGVSGPQDRSGAAFVDQAAGRPMYGAAQSTPRRFQTLQRIPAVDPTDDMNDIGIPIHGVPGSGRINPSSITVNAGSWDSMIEDGLPTRAGVSSESYVRELSSRSQLMGNDDRVDNFVRTQIRNGTTTRNPYEARHSLSLVHERVLQDQHSGQSSRNAEYPYATNLTVSSDGSTSESESLNEHSKSVSNSQREDKSNKGSSSRRGRRSSRPRV